MNYGSQCDAAEATTAWLTGVRNVKDDIKISYDADPVDVVVALRDALDRYALIPEDSDVLVDTRENTVTLTGHVHTWAEHDAVIDAAWMAPGVCEVLDDSSSPANAVNPRAGPRRPVFAHDVVSGFR